MLVSEVNIMSNNTRRPRSKPGQRRVQLYVSLSPEENEIVGKEADAAGLSKDKLIYGILAKKFSFPEPEKKIEK